MTRLVATLTILLAVMIVASQQKSDTRAKQKVNTLKTDLQKIRTKKSSVSRKLSTTKKKVRKARGDLHQIDGRLGKLEVEVQQTTNRLDRGQEEAKRLAGSLKVATHQLQEKRNQVRSRLRWMYVHENQGVVSTLISSSDVSEFASRAYLMKKIARADRQLFEEYAELRAEVARKKQRQDGLVVEIAGLKRDQENQQSELEVVRQDKAEVLGDLKQQQRDLERLIAELDAEENAIEARIAMYNRGPGKTSGLKPFTGRFSRPVGGPITSGFGMRYHPILHRTRMHNGIDFGAGAGTSILAAADGSVIAATYSKGYGNMVILDHGGGVSTLYGHCSRILVNEGQRIARGQRIALVGSTGLATGPHLHWEVRVNGRPINPARKL